MSERERGRGEHQLRRDIQIYIWWRCFSISIYLYIFIASAQVAPVAPYSFVPKTIFLHLFGYQSNKKSITCTNDAAGHNFPQNRIDLRFRFTKKYSRNDELVQSKVIRYCDIRRRSEDSTVIFNRRNQRVPRDEGGRTLIRSRFVFLKSAAALTQILNKCHPNEML